MEANSGRIEVYRLGDREYAELSPIFETRQLTARERSRNYFGGRYYSLTYQLKLTMWTEEWLFLVGRN